jgi:hypothetical protein
MNQLTITVVLEARLPQSGVSGTAVKNSVIQKVTQPCDGGSVTACERRQEESSGQADGENSDLPAECRPSLALSDVSIGRRFSGARLLLIYAQPKTRPDHWRLGSRQAFLRKAINHFLESAAAWLRPTVFARRAESRRLQISRLTP